jgi:hypothetical protein
MSVDEDLKRKFDVTKKEIEDSYHFIAEFAPKWYRQAMVTGMIKDRITENGFIDKAFTHYLEMSGYTINIWQKEVERVKFTKEEIKDIKFEDVADVEVAFKDRDLTNDQKLQEEKMYLKRHVKKGEKVSENTWKMWLDSKKRDYIVRHYYWQLAETKFKDEIPIIKYIECVDDTRALLKKMKRLTEKLGLTSHIDIETSFTLDQLEENSKTIKEVCKILGFTGEKVSTCFTNIMKKWIGMKTQRCKKDGQTTIGGKKVDYRWTLIPVDGDDKYLSDIGK